MSDPTARLRCHRMINHVGVVWLRLDRAGCVVRPGAGRDELDVWGDPDDIHRVLERWDGEGSIEVVEA